MSKLEELQYMLMENNDDASMADLEKFLKERNIDDDTKEALLLLASSYRARNEATKNTMLKLVTAVINEDKDEKESKVEEKPKSKIDGWIKFILIFIGAIVALLMFLFIMNFISQEHTSSTVKLLCDLIKNIGDAIRGQDIAALKS